MTQLTVRSVDESLHATLKREARQRGMSVNRYVVQVLSEVTGLSANQVFSQEYHDLDYLAGTWTPEQAGEFARFLDEQRQVDEGLWV
ncbi:MAG: type II toxin-antitoxin system HicB family antitoxin [Anaerolineae bacterium]|nr:type II toxin-antitoxin system HicB family antitoxin [Anaerolineae bacterium]